MDKYKKSEIQLNDLLEHFASSTHSPQGKFSSNESFAQLEKRISKKTVPFIYFKYISSVAAILLIFILSWTLCNDTAEPAAMMTVLTKAETKNVILPDGTRITLNHYSSLSYPKKFEEKNRKVALSGEAYFEVTKDTKHPFIVETKPVNIRVLGTHFNVEAYPNDPEIKTTLLKGSIAVCNKNNSRKLILKPNESAVYNKENASLTQAHTSKALDEIVWRQGDFIFSNCTLQEIGRKLSNSFGINIEIQDESLRNHKLTARFEDDERLEEILNLLKIVGDFSYIRNEEKIIIKSKLN